jgi:MFS family permease
VATDSVPWRSPTFNVVVASSLMGVMGVSLISPTLPAVQTALSLTDPEVSLLLTAFSLPGILLAPLIGILADRYGRRAVLVPCLLAYGITGGSIVFVREFGLVLALRVVQGSAASGLVTLAVTLIGDTFSGPRRNRLMGVNGAAISVGTASYPLIGGALAELSWTAPFALYLLGVPVGLLAIRALPPSDQGEARGLGYFQAVFDAVPTRRTAVVYGTYVLVFVVLYGAVLTALPLILARSYGLSAFKVGLVLTASSVMTAVVSANSGRLAARFTGDRLVSGGFVALGVGLLGVWAARSPAQVGVAILAFGAGMGMVLPSLDTITSSLAGREFRAGVTSFRTSSIRIGQTVGPPLFTAVAVVTGYGPLVLVAGLCTLAVGVVATRQTG